MLKIDIPTKLLSPFAMELFLYLTILFPLIHQGAYAAQDLYLMGLYPQEGGWSLPLGPLTSNLALEHINAKEDILPGYNLRVNWRNTQCLDKNALGSFIAYLQESNRTYLAIFGPGCSIPAVAIANVSPLYGLITLSYGAASPSLGDVNRYPFFIRGIESDTKIAVGRINFIHSHHWERVAIVNQQEEIFVYNSFVIQQALRTLNIDYRTATFDPRSNLVRQQISNVISLIREDGYRIIITNMYEVAAVQFICQFKESGPIPYMTWLFIGWYTTGWDQNAYEITNGSCTTQDIREVINGAIGFITFSRFADILQSDATTISGYTPGQLYDIYRQKTLEQNLDFDEERDSVDAYLYDSLWTYALGLNQTLAEGFDPSQFVYNQSEFTRVLYDNTLSQDFIGWTGRVSYYKRERISDSVGVYEFINGTIQYRGYYSNIPNNPDQFANTTGVTANITSFTVWNAALASDGIEIHFTSIAVFATTLTFAILIAIYILFLIIMILVGVKKSLPPATKSEPYLNIIILTGNYVSLLLAVLFTVDGKFFVNLIPNSITCITYCHMQVWLASVGISIIFGGVLAKASKYYIIIVKNKFNYTGWLQVHYLILFPLVLILIDTILIIMWAIIAPITYNSTVVSSGRPDPPLYRTYRCGISRPAFLIPIVVLNLGLVLLGTFLAYHLRKVVNKSQRYSSVIVWTMYTGVVFIAAIVLVITFVTDVDIRLSLAAALTLLQAFTTASIIAMPVMYYLIKDPKGTTFFKNINQEDFPEDTQLLKMRIAALERDLHAYKEKELEQSSSGLKRMLYRLRKATIIDNRSSEFIDKSEAKRSQTNAF